MPRDTNSPLQDLAVVCARLADARQQVAELEARRDELIRRLRDDGVSGAELANRTGLSPGRVAQIVNHNHPAARQ
jgi:hypothetical protein